MTEARAAHTATLLLDGHVLLVGGFDDSYADLASAELYDPKARTFVATGSMSVERSSGTATLLKNGQVLLAGAPPTLVVSCITPRRQGFCQPGRSERSVGGDRHFAAGRPGPGRRGAAFDQDRTIDSAELYTP